MYIFCLLPSVLVSASLQITNEFLYWGGSVHWSDSVSCNNEHFWLSLTRHANDVITSTVDPVWIEPEVLEQSELYTIATFHYERRAMTSYSQLSNTSDITHSWHRKSACDEVPVIPPARWNRISVRAQEIERRR